MNISLINLKDFFENINDNVIKKYVIQIKLYFFSFLEN